jgi:SAM-dependent methyltransferase
VDRLDKSSNKAFYNTERPDERRRFQTDPSKLHTAELLVPWVVRLLRPGDRMIDIAGGSGSYASQIVSAAPVSVVGVDISESMVRQRSEDRRLPDNAVADMEALPFAAESFDAAMFVACLHHVPDPLPALREAWRVLRPGGQVFAFEPCSLRAWRTGRLPVPGYAHEFAISVFWLAEQLRAAGFTIRDARGANIAIRGVRRVFRSPSLRVYHASDAVDRALAVIPGVSRLGSVGMIHATKAGEAETGTREPAPLACPRCKQTLEAQGGEALVCDRCRLAYPVADGVPLLLADEAAPL